MTKIITISDTHNQLSQVHIPEGDLLIHAGDFTMGGTFEEVAKFNYDCGQIKNKFKYGIVATCGNHDFLFEKHPYLARSLVTNYTYLQDESTIVNGLKIYGSPWTPFFLDWAFNLERGDEIKAKWDLIPDDTDILITHGPPAHILDTVPKGEDVGCLDLWWKLFEQTKHPKLHVFGHIHHSYGRKQWAWWNGGITEFVNAAICTEKYKPTNAPIVIDL